MLATDGEYCRNEYVDDLIDEELFSQEDRHTNHNCQQKEVVPWRTFREFRVPASVFPKPSMQKKASITITDAKNERHIDGLKQTPHHSLTIKSSASKDDSPRNLKSTDKPLRYQIRPKKKPSPQASKTPMMQSTDSNPFESKPRASFVIDPRTKQDDAALKLAGMKSVCIKLPDAWCFPRHLRAGSKSSGQTQSVQIFDDFLNTLKNISQLKSPPASKESSIHAAMQETGTRKELVSKVQFKLGKPPAKESMRGLRNSKQPPKLPDYSADAEMFQSLPKPPTSLRAVVCTPRDHSSAISGHGRLLGHQTAVSPTTAAFDEMSMGASGLARRRKQFNLMTVSPRIRYTASLRRDGLSLALKPEKIRF